MQAVDKQQATCMSCFALWSGVTLACCACSEAFMSALSGAILELHMPDRTALVEELMKEGKTLKEVQRLPGSYFKSR